MEVLFTCNDIQEWILYLNAYLFSPKHYFHPCVCLYINIKLILQMTIRHFAYWELSLMRTSATCLRMILSLQMTCNPENSFQTAQLQTPTQRMKLKFLSLMTQRSHLHHPISKTDLPRGQGSPQMDLLSSTEIIISDADFQLMLLLPKQIQLL